jgi:hypothetical protein
MNHVDLLFLLKVYLKEEDFKKKFSFKSKYYKTLKKPIIFHNLVGYLDDEGIYELKHVYKYNLGLQNFQQLYY